MSKGKVLYRRWYFDEWQADEAEAWLEDLAEQGWLLESIGTRFAKFRRGEPAPLRYACIPRHIFDTYENEDDAKNAFASAGWKFIDEHLKILAFCAPVGTKLPERSKDAPEADNKKAIRHYLWRILLYFAILAGLLLLFYSMISSGMLANYLLHKELRLFVYVLYLLSQIVMTGFYVPRLISQIRKIKEDGMEAVDSESVRCRYRSIIAWNRTFWIIYSAAILLLFASDLLPLLPQNSDKLTGHLSIVSVTDICGTVYCDGEGKADPILDTQGLLFPIKLETFDSFYLKDPVTGKYLPDREGILVEKAYHAQAPWLAALLAEQLAKYGDSGSYIFLTPTPIQPYGDTLGFDKLWGYSSPHRASMSLLALKGCDVYFLSYDGKTSIEALASVLNRKIEQAKGS